MEGVKSLAQWVGSQFDETLSWNDVDWIRSIWPGKLIIKGILDVEDAKLAKRTGATALVVSNHGGRQLDGAASSISVLPKVADAVGSEIEVMFDGGIRTGQDVLRALALGARSCLIGRAYIFGLGAGGEAGVTRAIELRILAWIRARVVADSWTRRSAISTRRSVVPLPCWPQAFSVKRREIPCSVAPGI
jgi:L-lactate dehydrogenase (cytochrome)